MSPRRISAWFRGRNRQSTLMLHSLLVSAMVVDDEGLGASPTAGVACAREEGNAGLGSRRRTGDLSLGPREQLGRPGEDALSVSCGTGCGRPGRLVLSPRCASPPLALQPRCGPGRGAQEPRGRGFLRRGRSSGQRPPRVEFAFCSLGSSIWRLVNNLVLTPSPHSSLRHTRPSVPPQTPPTGKDKGTKAGLSPAWERAPTRPPVPCIPEHRSQTIAPLSSHLNHTYPSLASFFPLLRCAMSQSAFMGVHLQK